MNVDVQHTDVGAYALGLLEEIDRRSFEAHLATCAMCHEELAGLRGVAAQLNGMPPIETTPPAVATAEADAAVVTDLVRRRARRERQQRRSRVLFNAAAGVVLVAGGAATGAALFSGGDDGGGTDQATPTQTQTQTQVVDGSTRTLLAGGQRHSATDARSGVTGTVALESKMWGSRVALQLSKVRGPLQCELIAVDKTGRAQVVTGWTVPVKGYGLPGSPMPSLAIQGGTALQPADIQRFEVRTMAGETLLTVPA